MIYTFRDVNEDMNDRNALFNRLRAIAALVLVALYALGLVAMLTKRKEEAEKAAQGENAPGEP